MVEIRSIPVPAHRYTPLKNHWDEVMTPLIEHLHLLIRFNPRKRAVELKVCRRSSCFTGAAIAPTVPLHGAYFRTPALMHTATRPALLPTDERAYHRANRSAKG